MERRTFDAGLDLARRLRDPELRAALKGLTGSNSHHIVMADPDESISSVMDRLFDHGVLYQAVVAIPDPADELGFRFLGVTVDGPPRD